MACWQLPSTRGHVAWSVVHLLKSLVLGVAASSLCPKLLVWGRAGSKQRSVVGCALTRRLWGGVPSWFSVVSSSAKRASNGTHHPRASQGSEKKGGRATDSHIRAVRDLSKRSANRQHLAEVKLLEKPGQKCPKPLPGVCVTMARPRWPQNPF